MRKITDINANILKQLLGKVEQLHAIHERVIVYLPEELRPFCHVANFENGVLKFAVASPAWAMRLRYAIPDLLRRLRQEADLARLASIEYYIEAEFDQIFKR